MSSLQDDFEFLQCEVERLKKINVETWRDFQVLQEDKDKAYNKGRQDACNDMTKFWKDQHDEMRDAIFELRAFVWEWLHLSQRRYALADYAKSSCTSKGTFAKTFDAFLKKLGLED